MPSATSAAVGWSVVFLVAGGFYFVSNLRKNKNRRTLPTKGTSNLADSRRESKSKKDRKEVGTTRGKHEARPNRKGQQSSNNTEASQITLVSINNTELTAGINSQTSYKSKPQKQNHTQGQHVSTEEKQRAESSDNTTGNEADDESVINIPKLGIAAPKSLSATQDISDMLEKPVTQPGILKITAPTSIKTNKLENRRNDQKPERVETKKQRQNRQKAIESKTIRAQEEQARKLKMENQRRTAREAEGRAAKDGSLFMASQSPSSSAWTNVSSASNGLTVPQPEPQYSESEEIGSARQEVSALSEEEQVRHAIKETETWNVVKGKERRNRAAKSDDQRPSFTDIKTQEYKNVNSIPGIPMIPNQLDSPNHFVKDRGHFNDKNVVLEDSEWEVS